MVIITRVKYYCMKQACLGIDVTHFILLLRLKYISRPGNIHFKTIQTEGENTILISLHVCELYVYKITKTFMECSMT